MYKQILFFALFLIIPIISFAQATENQIPFTENTDLDSEINVVDMDDDNDGVIDNDDVFPLDALLSGPIIIQDTVLASEDAGLRSNSSNTSNKNYGADPVIQTKNGTRSFAVKVPVPANLDLNSAQFIFYSDSEDDPLAVYYLPVSTWSESTVTYNTMDFTGQQLLGISENPVGGIYTYDLPLNILPEGGGDITLWVFDSADPNNSNEGLKTKEFVGDGADDEVGDQAPRIIFNSNEIIDPKVEINQSAGTNKYIEDGPFVVQYRLTEEPSSPVYLPLQIVSDDIADITGDEYLVFDDTNWSVYQMVNIDPTIVGAFDIHLRPLHSLDNNFNGHNPSDLEGYIVQSVKLTNLANWTVETGESFSQDLTAVHYEGDELLIYSIEEGPSGLNVTEIGGTISFTPLNFQIGIHDVIIKVVDSKGNINFQSTTIEVTDGNAADPMGIIVDLNAPDNPNANGSGANPYNDIIEAIDSSLSAGGGDVLIRGGEYEITAVMLIGTDASAVDKITIKPLGEEAVKLNFAIRAVFQFTETSRNIGIQGLEIDGGTDELDFWCIVGQSVWGDESVERGGGLCVIANGEDIFIKDCYLHDAYQKGVEITGRYVDIEGNIIERIATTSISGGHGIMRQQQGREFFDADDPSKYRWDINSNMLLNIEQRIYSWVPSKGFMEMVIDEGKPILIDDPKDTDGIPDTMRARITNNVVAFGSVDHIRLKATQGLEVSNNSVFSETEEGDGITDKVGDPQANNSPSAQTFINFKCTNNASRTKTGTNSLEVDTALSQDTLPNGENKSAIWQNFGMGGSIKPDPQVGLNYLDPVNGELFINPTQGNFRLNPALNLPDTIGVDPLTLDTFDMQAEKFGLDIKWDGWITDNLLLSQSILDNMPGVRDGIANNDTVLIEGSCEMNATRKDLDCDIRPNTYWVAKFTRPDKPFPDTMQFRLNHEYTDWYLEIETDYPGYERIRWGDSYLKQNQVFDQHWLTHSQIKVDTNTIIYGPGKDFTLDGDIVIEFKDFTPANGDYFDLIIASNITSSHDTLFDNVYFKGYTPADYSFEIVDLDQGKAARLTIGSCALLVSNTSDSGTGSLRDAIGCAMDGDTIHLGTGLANQVIKLTTTKLIIDKNLTIIGDGSTTTVENCVNGQALEIAAGKTVTLKDFIVSSDNFINNGILNCSNMSFKAKTSQLDINFHNGLNSEFNTNNTVIID